MPMFSTMSSSRAPSFTSARASSRLVEERLAPNVETDHHADGYGLPASAECCQRHPCRIHHGAGEAMFGRLACTTPTPVRVSPPASAVCGRCTAARPAAGQCVLQQAAASNVLACFDDQLHQCGSWLTASHSGTALIPRPACSSWNSRAASAMQMSGKFRKRSA